jgi:hypothetical protein
MLRTVRGAVIGERRKRSLRGRKNRFRPRFDLESQFYSVLILQLFLKADFLDLCYNLCAEIVKNLHNTFGATAARSNKGSARERLELTVNRGLLEVGIEVVFNIKIFLFQIEPREFAAIFRNRDFFIHNGLLCKVNIEPPLPDLRMLVDLISIIRFLAGRLFCALIFIFFLRFFFLLIQFLDRAIIFAVASFNSLQSDEFLAI